MSGPTRFGKVFGKVCVIKSVDSVDVGFCPARSAVLSPEFSLGFLLGFSLGVLLGVSPGFGSDYRSVYRSICGSVCLWSDEATARIAGFSELILRTQRHAVRSGPWAIVGVVRRQVWRSTEQSETYPSR